MDPINPFAQAFCHGLYRGRGRLTYEQLEDRLSKPGNGLGDIYFMDVASLHLEGAK